MKELDEVMVIEDNDIVWINDNILSDVEYIIRDILSDENVVVVESSWKYDISEKKKH